jgi:GcrA cell cycle regulator
MSWGPSWTAERIAELKDLWARHFTASQVAKKMGGITRNAVLGKLHRMNGAARPALPKAQRPKRPRRKVEYKPPSPIGELPQAVDLPADESFFACSIIELTPTTCRWPLDGDPMLYCGAQKGRGSYCVRHYRIGHRLGR